MHTLYWLNVALTYARSLATALLVKDGHISVPNQSCGISTLF